MLEWLEYPFMQRAVLACLSVGSLAAFLSVFVVQRRLAFIGSGLAHASFGGVAIGIYFGFNPSLAAGASVLLLSILLTKIRQKTFIQSDTIIGILMSAAMALGIFLLSQTSSFGGDAMSYLFGSVLSVQSADLYFAWILVVVVIFSMKLWTRWAFESFDSELAECEGLPVQRDELFLNILLGLSIVASLKVLGVVLLSAFLILPGASARLISKSFSGMLVFSVAVGVVTSLAGLVLSYSLDTPISAAIILIQTGLLGLLFVIRRS